MQAHVDFDPDAQCPLWTSCLKRWQPDDEIREYLQLEAGAGATGMPTETLTVHYGTGANGKSKFTRTILAVLGDYGCVPNKSLLMT